MQLRAVLTNLSLLDDIEAVHGGRRHLQLLAEACVPPGYAPESQF